jgi:murein DD-endopeptidase MepM/ murein hydrolase activator NlpD
MRGLSKKLVTSWTALVLFMRRSDPPLFNVHRGRFFLVAFVFFLVSFLCHAEETGSGIFPQIMRLDRRDDGFKQYIADVEANRKRAFNLNQGNSRENAGVLAGSLTVFQYTPHEGDDIFSLAARCNIPYSALVSLNRVNHPSMLELGKPLLLPSMPGIFVPQEPQSDLEHLLASGHFPQTEGDSVMLTLKGSVFYFFPGSEFSATERAFFLNRSFRFPLRTYQLSSRYGMRENPISGNMRFHEGVDLAAPLGTEVYSAGDGIVTETGVDPVYGNYIVIKHGENWASLYGHLQRVGVTLRSSVKSGTLIGWVGSTGQSTGPHLHFELRQNGRAQDPDKYLFLPGRR